MGDIINEDETGHPPSLGQSRHERMQEQYSNFVEEEEHWQDVRRLRHGCVSPPPVKCAVLSSFLGDPVTGVGSLEESPPQRLAGTHQEGGRAEEDGEKAEGGGKRQSQEKEHQNLQRDCGGQVSGNVDQ